MSKATRHHNARAARRANVKVKTVEQEMFWLADNNPTGFLTGGRTWQYMQELIAERDALIAAHPVLVRRYR